MRCLYCGKRIALLRRLSDGEFCTLEHRTAYHAEQQQLAIKRLMEAQWPLAKPADRPQPPPLFVDETEVIPASSNSPKPELKEPELSVFLRMAPESTQAEAFSPLAAEVIQATVALILPEAIGLTKRSAISGQPVALSFEIQAGNPPPAMCIKMPAEQTVPAICLPPGVSTIDFGGSLLWRAPDWGRPDLQLEDVELPLFLRVALEPRPAGVHSPLAEGDIQAAAALMFPEAIGPAKPSAKDGQPVALSFDIHPADIAPLALVDPQFQQSNPAICRPYGVSTVEFGNSHLHGEPAWGSSDSQGKDPQSSVFLLVAPKPGQPVESALLAADAIGATVALMLPEANGLLPRQVRAGLPVTLAFVIQPANPPPPEMPEPEIQQCFPAICRPVGVSSADFGNSPSESLQCWSPPDPGLQDPQPFVLLCLGPHPRQAREYSPLAADMIQAAIAPILPEAVGFAKRSDKAGLPAPLSFVIQPAKFSPLAMVDPQFQQSVPAICLPGSLSTIECGSFRLPLAQASNASDGPLAESLAGLATQLSLMAGAVPAIAGIAQVTPQLDRQAPLVCTLPGQAKWLSASLELAGNLPMAIATAGMGYAPCNLGTEETQQITHAALLTSSIPGFIPQGRRGARPPGEGTLQWFVPVPQRQLPSGKALNGAWGQMQVQSVPHKPEAAHLHLRTQHGGFERSLNASGQPVRLDLMPAAKQPAIPNGESALWEAVPLPPVEPRLELAACSLGIASRQVQAAKWIHRAAAEFPRSLESAQPVARPPEEILAWLDVPLFELPHPQKRRWGAHLCGITGLEQIPASPRRAGPARSAEVEPSFSGIRPLFGQSRLTTAQPPLLSRKDRFLSEAEDLLRENLSSIANKSRFPIWRGVPGGKKWLTLSLPIVVVILFQAATQKRSSLAAGKPEVKITEQIEPAGAQDTSPIRESVPLSRGGKEVAAQSAPSGLEPAGVKPAASKEPSKNSESGSTMLGGVQGFFDQRMRNLKLNLADRASVDLTDDFRSGLAGWEGRGDWSQTWTYDRIGLLRPGQLALYQPSMGLSDYTLEFRATAERGYIGWVFRARDLNNYYGIRLQVMKSGPGSSGLLERWVVSGGREHSRKTLPMRIPIWAGNITHLRLDVEGSSFTTFVNGQIADTWTDTRIDSGGVGFFNDKGSDARIHRMSVSHQNDIVGKLCAMLAPHDLIYKQNAGQGR